MDTYAVHGVYICVYINVYMCREVGICISRGIYIAQHIAIYRHIYIYVNIIKAHIRVMCLFMCPLGCLTRHALLYICADTSNYVCIVWLVLCVCVYIYIYVYVKPFFCSMEIYAQSSFLSICIHTDV